MKMLNFATIFIAIMVLAIATLIVVNPAKQIIVSGEQGLDPLVGLSGGEVVASWYGYESCVHEDCRMANTEVFNENENICASRFLALGTILELTHNGTTQQCTVKDRISKNFSDRIDLSKGLFAKFAPHSKGIIRIKYDIIIIYDH
jgi:hypothetical protein